MKRNALFTLMVLLCVCHVAKAEETDYTNLPPLKLETPAVDMKLDCKAVRTYRPELELPLSPMLGESQKYQLTWMRTNPV